MTTSQHNINIDVDGTIRDDKGNEFLITDPTPLRPYYVVKIKLANEETVHPSSDVIANAVSAISDRAQEEEKEPVVAVAASHVAPILSEQTVSNLSRDLNETRITKEEMNKLEEMKQINIYIKLMLQQMKLWWSESNGKIPDYKKQIIQQITDNELYNKYIRQIENAYDYGVCYIYDNRPKGYIIRTPKPSSNVLFDIKNWDNYKENKEGILEQYKLNELINDFGKPYRGGNKKRRKTRRLRKSQKKRKSRSKLRK
jgi:hypothetical protein